MDIVINGHTLAFGEFLNERTETLPIRDALVKAISAANGERVIFDFSSLEKANSVGILEFLKLLKEFSTGFKYVNTPVWLVEQFNIMTDFFKNDVIVESVLAHFYCPDTDAMHTRLLKIGNDIPILDDYSDFEITLKTEDGHRLEPDFDPPSYFDFISRRAELFRRSLT